jgi:hypothetical protein
LPSLSDPRYQRKNGAYQLTGLADAV